MRDSTIREPDAAPAGQAAPASCAAASASRATRRPRSTSTRVSSQAPITKKTIRAQDRGPARAGRSREHDAEHDVPIAPPKRSKTPKKPNISPALCCGISVAKSERESAWAPPCTVADQERRARRTASVVRSDEAVDGMPHVDGEGDEDRPLGADAVGQDAEGERERHAHELDHEERADQRGVGMPISSPKIVAMPDDRVDRVVVDQEGEQQQPGVLVALRSSRKVSPRRRTATARRLAPSASPARAGAAGSGTLRKSGIEKSAHQTATLRKDTRVAACPRRRGRSVAGLRSSRGSAPGAGPPPEVAEGEAGGRDAVDLVGLRDRRAAASCRRRGSRSRRCCRPRRARAPAPSRPAG